MSDFDERLRAALERGADQAPGTTGLADAARRRNAARRRKQIVAGGVAIVLTAAAPSVAMYVADRGGAGPASDPAPAGWQSIEHEGTELLVPADWAPVTCGEERPDVVQYAAGGSCGNEGGLLTIFPAEEEEDAGAVSRTHRAGGESYWGGYVEAGEWGAAAFATDRQVVFQVLASFRLQGQPQVVVDGWENVVDHRIAYRMPVGWGVQDGAGYGVEVDTVASRAKRLKGSDTVDAAHYRLVGQLPEHIVTITAPTRAVAQLVWGSVQAPSRPDAAHGLICDPGLGDPSNGEGCPHSYSTGWLSLGPDHEVIYHGKGGSPYVLDLGAFELCSGVIQVGYREPLEDHVVECSEFRDALEEQPGSRIPVAIWSGRVDQDIQLSELYRP